MPSAALLAEAGVSATTYRMHGFAITVIANMLNNQRKRVTSIFQPGPLGSIPPPNPGSGVAHDHHRRYQRFRPHRSRHAGAYFRKPAQRYQGRQGQRHRPDRDRGASDAL